MLPPGVQITIRATSGAFGDSAAGAVLAPLGAFILHQATCVLVSKQGIWFVIYPYNRNPQIIW